MSPEVYGRSHRDRVNLAIHLLAVPLFWLGCISALTFLAMGQWSGLAGSAAALAVSMGLQGLGHKREAIPPEPFAGPGDFIARIFVEQFWRFPYFVLSGGLWRNFRVN